MPGDSGATVVTNSRVFYTTREAAGALGARHSPRPQGEGFTHNSGASRRGNAEAYLELVRRRCEEQSDEAIHFTMPRYGLLR
jgi:hypothetical protein